MRDIRCLEDLCLLSYSHEHELAITRERKGTHRTLEIEMSDDNSLQKVNDQSETININSDKCPAIW